MAADLHLSQDPDADALLSRDPLALLLGMLLDQQIPMEKAFRGPAVLLERLGHLDAAQIADADPEGFAAPRLLADRLGVDALDAAALAAADPEELTRIFQGPPALHRYPGSMAGRTQALCRLLVKRYDGRAENLWVDVPDGTTLLRRVGELPGFGAQKSKIFVALLGKRYGVTPPGWREAAGAYAEDGSTRSVADITGPESLAEVRRFKQAQKQAQDQTQSEPITS